MPDTEARVVTPFFRHTRRLGFRSWTEGDLELAMMLWGDPSVMALIAGRGTLTRHEVADRLAAEIACARAHGIQYWPLFSLTSGDFVEACGLRPYRLAERVLELGVHIRAARWGRGYAFEAATQVIDHAFRTQGAARLFAGHHPANDRSRRLIQRLGFRYERDEVYPPTGERHPSYLLDAPS